MQIEPEYPVGYRTDTMVVVTCPTCGKKRWANILFGKDKKGGARTTCCGSTTSIGGMEP